MGTVAGSIFTRCDYDTEKLLKERSKGPVFLSDSENHQNRMVMIQPQLIKIAHITAQKQLKDFVQNYKDQDATFYVKFNRAGGNSEWFYWSDIGKDKILILYIEKDSSIVVYSDGD